MKLNKKRYRKRSSKNKRILSKQRLRKRSFKGVGKKSNKKAPICPDNMNRQKLPNGDIICIGRCPHSGGKVVYVPKLDKLKCSLHGAQFEKSGKVILGSGPAQSNVKVKKAKAN